MDNREKVTCAAQKPRHNSMKYYAAILSEWESIPACMQPPYCILASFHYFKTQPEFIKQCLAKNWDVFFDSGAFSAENSNKEISIDDYCKFILETGLTTYAGLDVIGNAKATRYNMEYMQKEYGLNPIPTFHMGSNIDDLAELVHGQYGYVALGGLVFGKNITNHCDAVWHYILTHNPKLRIHGFGLTNVDLMKRYPWYSVDSSSYKSCRRYGRQNIIWNDFDFQTFEEEEYNNILRSMGHNVPPKIKATKDMTADRKSEIAENNKHRFFLYDFYSVQSYKLYGAYLKELNKTRKFNFLTDQQKLF